MKRVAILGATGSIGVQALDIIRQHPGRLQAVALAAGQDAEKLTQLGAEHQVADLALSIPGRGLPGGQDELIRQVTRDDVDVVVVAIAGAAALVPTLRAIEAGKQIALATKEVLVAAGELVMPLLRRHGVEMTPIDSEHSAIFQCLAGAPENSVRSLTLTASGGPFRGKTRADLTAVTVEQALNHPTWRMGGKITIDSATLMNKALEMIEAKWLFGVEMDAVRVVVHPQSVIHSMVEFADGSFLGQLGWPDMRLPIQVALLWPDRVENGMRPWNPVETPSLTFEPVDEEAFGALALARTAEKIGGTTPCAFNAANEAAVAAFLAGKMGFLAITETVERAVASHSPQAATLETLLEADAWARRFVEKEVAARA